ncbi:hypothetical protein LSAT2_024748, partial [Lamellibrachia satsuma]
VPGSVQRPACRASLQLQEQRLSHCHLPDAAIDYRRSSADRTGSKAEHLACDCDARSHVNKIGRRTSGRVNAAPPQRPSTCALGTDHLRRRRWCFVGRSVLSSATAGEPPPVSPWTLVINTAFVRA